MAKSGNRTTSAKGGTKGTKISTKSPATTRQGTAGNAGGKTKRGGY